MLLVVCCALLRVVAGRVLMSFVVGCLGVGCCLLFAVVCCRALFDFVGCRLSVVDVACRLLCGLV